MKTALYRVYGFLPNGGPVDEYEAATSSQDAADRVRGWYPGIKIVEVAKVVKGWR